MNLNNLSIPSYTGKDIIEAIYDQNFSAIHKCQFETDDDINRFNTYADDFDIEPLSYIQTNTTEQIDFDSVAQQQWFCPAEYLDINLENYLLDRCSTEEEKTRVVTELHAFYERGLGDLLKYMIYLVDTMRENNILWGVGRGSSVASFVLYLIGIHRINPLEYDLDWQEFLR